MLDRLPVPRGFVSMRIFRDGTLVEDWTGENLVVSAAGQVNASNLGGATAGNSITQVGFGPNGSQSVPGNVSLGDGAYIKNIDAISFPLPNQVAFTFSLGTFEANGQVIAEFGLFTGNGTLYARLVRNAPLVKDLSMSLEATWTVAF